MAIKIKVAPQTTTIQEDKIYIDTSKLASVVQTMKGDFNKIQTSLKNLSNLMNQAKKGNLQGYYESLATDLVKICNAQAGYAQQRAKALTTKYEADSKDYDIALLKSTVQSLEKSLNELKKQNNAGTAKSSAKSSATFGEKVVDNVGDYVSGTIDAAVDTVGDVAKGVWSGGISGVATGLADGVTDGAGAVLDLVGLDGAADWAKDLIDG